MLTSMFQSSTIPVLEQVVNFTEARHGVLAGNVANLDTPGYKTRDLSPQLFQEKLKQAVETSHQSFSPTYKSDLLGLTSAQITKQHEAKQLEAFRQVEDSMKSILRHDGDDVSMEQQINEIVKNQQQHNLAINIMSAQFRLWWRVRRWIIEFPNAFQVTARNDNGRRHVLRSVTFSQRVIFFDRYDVVGFIQRVRRLARILLRLARCLLIGTVCGDSRLAAALARRLRALLF